MITVHKLQKILENCDKGAVVIFQHEFSMTAMIITRVETENLVYNHHFDEVLYANLTPELIEQGYEDDEMDNGTGIKCIVLWSDK